ncbi:hypothetical protein CTRI78_v011670 [Colletotrichum trifolii]|uniref:Transmembrane protein n=1 Tax=Colletotrichum trifolii TaxID=5466 RepID=A0A4R8Q4W6_COLTR|nr:hypothetical protein CTRI78_v011670 [Colletotrichum trifolii]
MDEQGTQGKWHDLADRLLHRGLISDFLNNPNSVISEVLSPPAATTQEAANGSEHTASTATGGIASFVAETGGAADICSGGTSTDDDDDDDNDFYATGGSTADDGGCGGSGGGQQVFFGTCGRDKFYPWSAGGGESSSGRSGFVDGVVKVGGSFTSNECCRKRCRGHGFFVAISVVATTDGSHGPECHTYVLFYPLGIVVFMGISLLLFWCYRRRRKANKHHHEALAPQGPVDDENLASNPRLRDTDDPENLLMTEPRAVPGGQDHLAVQHPQPPPSAASHARHGSRDSAPDEQGQQPRTNPFAGQPSFTYAQAQQYAQSHGAFSYPAPPIPDSSPIRIFRWPTRSSRSGSSPSIFSALRSSKAASRNSRAMSRASRSTVSSMLWHGRRDVARRTLVPAPPQTPSSQRAGNGSGNGNGFLSATPNTAGTGTGTGESPMPSPMPDGLHTPILDWLHWIRGHQSDGGGDPESNHRKSIASLTESAVSEGSIASSGVLSPTLLSWPQQQDGNTTTTTTTTTTRVSVMRARGLTFVPILPPGKRQSSNGDTLVDPSAYRLYG